MTNKVKPGLKSKVAARTAQLVHDLNSVRSAIFSKQQQLNPAEYARLEPRLFESWVIDKLAENECLVLALNEQLMGLREELDQLRKSLPRPDKKTRKEK